MTKKIYVVTDLGPGDGGKGGVVHKIALMQGAHTVIKRGGAQGSHGVRNSKGESFNFSQWGCGTLEGTKTHISSQFITHPEGLINEANALKNEHGIYNPFDLLTIDQESLCATPYHGISSRLKEMARRNNPRGTIGTGVGEAYRDYRKSPEMSILVKDLRGPDLKDKLAYIRDKVRQDLKILTQDDSNFLKSDLKEFQRNVDLLHSDGFFDHIYEKFIDVSMQANIVDHSYLGDVILSRDGVAVVECSHGVLTDREMGFQPHTSAIRTLPSFTNEMLRQAGFGGKIVNLGVTRAYAIRHGAGPMPTTDLGMGELLLPGSNKSENRYQGKVRVGPMDLVLLRYAIEACGGPSFFDGLAITWFDQIQVNKVWDLCNQYDNADDLDFFSPSGDIKVDKCIGHEHHLYQLELTQKLFQCIPKQIIHRPIGLTMPRGELFDICASELNELVKVPVRLLSVGPTELDKLCR